MKMNFRPFLKIDGGGRCRRDHRHPVLLGHLGDGLGMGVVGPEDHVDLLPGDELFVDGDRRGGLGLIVFHGELEPASKDAALLVRVLDAELVAAKLVLT